MYLSRLQAELALRDVSIKWLIYHVLEDIKLMIGKEAQGRKTFLRGLKFLLRAVTTALSYRDFGLFMRFCATLPFDLKFRSKLRFRG